jgi:hypothetical protein
MQYVKYYITVFFLFAFLGKTFSREGDFKYSAGGFVELDHFSFLKEKSGLINHRNQSTALLNIESQFNNSYAFFSSVEFRNDLSDSRRNRAYLKEAYIDIFSQKIDLRTGKQVIPWGKADGFNPTDNLNPTDYSDILDTEDETLGILAANIKLYLGDWQIQGVFSPAFQASILPGSGSRWQQDYPSFVIYNGVDLPARFHWREDDIPGNKFRDSQFAFKISKTAGNVDFSFSYYSGLNDIPDIGNGIESVMNDTVNIAISQNYYRRQVTGADFSCISGKYVFKGEGALFIPDGINTDDSPYFQYVLGFDRIFGNIAGNKSLFVTVQWIHELKNKNAEYDGKDFNHLFQKNLMSRIEMELNRDMKLSLQLIYAFKYEDFYIKPEFKYNISDGLNLNLSMDIAGGNKNKNGFFASYADNDRIQIKLKYNF